ncbi:MAG: translation initiation factor [Bdellovibrionaceae bacterium]|nr:translation initiation factor [Pseudobdellovibrionaceae bacterium]
MSAKDRVLVYSTDPKDQALITGEAQKTQLQNEQKNILDTKKYVVVFRIETQSRGGKTVTVLDKLPAVDSFLKDLTKEIKMKCGTGGSYKIENSYGTIEIQGDKREPIKKMLDQKQIKYKGM